MKRDLHLQNGTRPGPVPRADPVQADAEWFAHAYQWDFDETIRHVECLLFKVLEFNDRDTWVDPRHWELVILRLKSMKRGRSRTLKMACAWKSDSQSQ